MKEWIACAEWETGFHVIVIRTDGAKEFDDEEEWQGFYRETGIRHELTVPYTPQQNGLSECGHRTLTGSVITMLQDSKLPNYLWAEAYNFKRYTMTVTSSSRQKGLTPYKRWHKCKPNVAYLRPFGCIGYVRVPDEIRTKLDTKQRRCIS
jgi:hypothetical protein